MVLDSPDSGLYVQTLTWGSQYQFSSGAVLLVLVSNIYDDVDYVREYADFIHQTKDMKTG